ncbi:MAG: response regulator [Spartobacteria bacterium]
MVNFRNERVRVVVIGVVAALAASSAEDGLRMVSENSPDVIVSDIGMPEKDGLEMMREQPQELRAAVANLAGRTGVEME